MIKEIEIFKFRNFKEGLKIEIGKHLTLISGKNGTSKTTLLGMLAKPFKGNEKDIYSNEMSGTFSEIFKINSEYDKESRKEPIYKVYPSGKFFVQTKKGEKLEKNDAPAYIIKRSMNELRIWTSNKNTVGEGQRLCPVIYLGLKRLYPIAELKNNDLKSNNQLMKETEKEKFIKDYRSILNINNKLEIDKVLDKKNTKNTVLVKGETFGGITNSSGQDNIGQIIGAVLSYERLSQHKDYNGGLLIIDEIESSLHPDTQINVIDYLLRKSRKLNIQIIISTHSFEIIEYLTKLNKEEIKIHYLLNKSNQIENIIVNLTELQKIKQNLYNEKVKKENKKKKNINLFYEDEEGKKWGQQILGKYKNSEYSYKHENLNLGWKDILKVSKYINGLIILDGDIPDEKLKNKENIIKLPMEFCPEEEAYHFLESKEVLDFFNKEYNVLNIEDKIFEVKNNPVELLKDERGKTDYYKTWYKELEKRTGIKKKEIIKLWIEKNKKKSEEHRKGIEEKIKSWPKV